MTEEDLLEVHHPVPAPGGGSAWADHLLPAAGGEVETPEVSVVVELRLRGGGELATEHPQLPTQLRQQKRGEIETA